MPDTMKNEEHIRDCKCGKQPLLKQRIFTRKYYMFCIDCDRQTGDFIDPRHAFNDWQEMN